MLLLLTNQIPTPVHANIAAKAEDFDFPCCSIVFAFFNSYTSRSPVNTHIYNKPKTPDSNSVCLVKEDPVVGELPPDQPHPLPDLRLSKLDLQQPLLTHLREQTKLHHLHHLLNSSNKALLVQVSLDRWLLPLRIFATNPFPQHSTNFRTQRCSSWLLDRPCYRWILWWWIFSTCCRATAG